MANPVALPEGFVLDDVPSGGGLPQGFVLDSEEHVSPQAQEETSSSPFVVAAKHVGKGLSEAGGAIAQAAVNTANIVPMVADAFNSAGAWAMGDETYMPAPRLSLPEGVFPQTQAGQVAAEVLPYLTSSPARIATTADKLAEHAVRAASHLLQRVVDRAGQLISESFLGSAAHNSGNQNLEQATNDTLQDVAMNAGIGGAVHGVGKVINAARGGASAKIPAAAITDSANEVSNLARSRAGREILAKQAAQVSEVTARAAEIAGVYLNRLTPGMTSESRGIAHGRGRVSVYPRNNAGCSPGRL